MISDRAKRAGLKELDIFDYFRVDRKLPKYQHVPKNESGSYIQVGGSTMSTDTGTTANSIWVSVPDEGVPVNDNWGSITVETRSRLKRWFFDKCCKKFLKRGIPFNGKRLLSVTEFFTSFGENTNELAPLADIAKHYEKVLQQSLEMGQTALVEEIKNNLEVIKGEAVLIQTGVTQYVTEQQVIDFYEKTKENQSKHLKLSWIENFGRVIPKTVYDLKKKIDAKKIFDNYVVLHYDPKEQGTKLTKKEIERKKDPILFGVIKNSRKLYFIADWKDEYCDLTLEEMFKTLKGKVATINNRNVKSYVSKIKA